jgi:truncated hemoglobin YjbI
MSSMPLGSDALGRTGQTLLARLGGEPVLANIIKGLYRSIFEDDELKHFFRNVDMKKVTSHQYEFL